MATSIVPIIGAFNSSPAMAARIDVTIPAEESSEKRVPIVQLDVKHPEYASRYESWIDLALLYEGGGLLKAKCERLLKKRPREDEEVFAARMDRLVYNNILGTGLGYYGAAMFGISPEVLFDGKSGPEFYTKFLENCDGIGTTYVDFWKRIFQMMLTFGSAWVLTDLKAIEGDYPAPATLQQEKEMGLDAPHLIGYGALNVINWHTDERGELRWVVVKTEVETQEFLQDTEVVTTWYYFNQTEYKVYEYRRSVSETIEVANDSVGKTAELLRVGKHALWKKNRVPIRRVMLTDGLWLANRAYLQLCDHFNQDNTLAWALFMSNLAIPIIIGDVDTTNMTQSEAGYMQFPAGTTYEWSEPAGTSFAMSAQRVDSLREECFRSMHLQSQGRSMHATPAMQSGRSKQLEMAPANKVLAGMGDDLRRHMQDVLCDVRDAKGDKNVNPNVRGFSFEEDMSTEEVFAVSSLLGMRVPSKSFEKYIFKKVAKAWMGDATRKDLTKVYDEIDKGPTIEEREEEDFQKRVKLAKDGIKGALQKQLTSGGPEQPPGRGGEGSAPPRNV